MDTSLTEQRAAATGACNCANYRARRLFLLVLIAYFPDGAARIKFGIESVRFSKAAPRVIVV